MEEPQAGARNVSGLRAHKASPPDLVGVRVRARARARARVGVRVRVRVRHPACWASCSLCVFLPESSLSLSLSSVPTRPRHQTFVDNKVAQPSASRLSGGSPQRQVTPQAAPRFGQPRPAGRLGCAGRCPHRAWFSVCLSVCLSFDPAACEAAQQRESEQREAVVTHVHPRALACMAPGWMARVTTRLAGIGLLTVARSRLALSATRARTGLAA